MTYNDYGHINPDPVSALGIQIGPKSVITYPSGGQKLSGPGFLRDQRPGVVRRAPIRRWKSPPTAARAGKTPSCGRRHIPWRIRGLASTGIGTEKNANSSRAAPTNWARFNPLEPKPPSSLTNPWTTTSAPRRPTIRFNRGKWPAMGAFTMGSPKLLPLVTILGICSHMGLAQSPTHNRPPMVWDGPRPRKKSVPGISRSVLRERNSRRGAEPPRKARNSFGRRDAPDVMGQPGSEPGLRR